MLKLKAREKSIEERVGTISKSARECKDLPVTRGKREFST